MTTAADFGLDFWCDGDLAPDLRTTTGLELAQQAIAARLSTPHGMVIDDPDYGEDLSVYLSAALTKNTLPKIIGAALGQIQKDDRIQNASVTARLSGPFDARIVELDIGGTFLDAPFALTLAITDVSVSVLKSGGT